MDSKLLKTLEFDIIRERLSGLTSSELSRKLCDELLPCGDFEAVAERLRETDDAVAVIMRKGRPPLGGLVDVVPSVKRACGGSMLSFPELLHIGGVLKAARRTLNHCGEGGQNDAETNVIIGKIGLLEEDYRLESEIFRCIVSEDEMADEASSTLLDTRRKIAREQASIREKLNDFIHSQKYAKTIQDGVITMRGDRYCIPVKSEYKSEFPGIVHDMSGSGQTLFIEPASVVESNNKIRELRVKEKQEIERITLLLGSLCAEKADLIIKDVRLLAEIDFAFAKASLGLAMKAHKPQINAEGRIKILKGRHPLIDPLKVVPISVYIGEKFKTLVITGPNTGGKTVTLKTVGLFTLMLQAGLLVPCESTSELAVFKDVFADIGDEQSIAQSLSTFSAHMSNIVRIMKGADENVLVLLDELGAGTDPTEGAALAMAILESLYQMGATTLATTHYSELKAFTATTEGFENACCEFDVETLSPTYRLMIGVPGKSNAFAISKKLGLEAAVVERAGEFLTSEDVRFEDMLSDIEKRRGEIEESQRRVRELTEEADRLKKELDGEKEMLAAKKDELNRKAREDAAKIVADAKKESEKLIAEMRKLVRDAEENKDRLKEAETLRRELGNMNDAAYTAKVEVRRKPVVGEQVDMNTPLLPGQTLYSASIDGNVSVLKPQNKDGNVFVQAGIMKMYLPVSDLIIAGAPPEEKDDKKPGKYASNRSLVEKAMNIRPEIDLRGMTAEEAVNMTDRYIDDAVAARLENVTIIHGKGTGVLRKEIHKMLKRDRRVREFRDGEFGEGDFGVTVAKLKI
ncbi:MAG: endonuclease MutS2 [Clostridia bacterium]|nr:endonuclease MutS2 [Clostridia bacterium]